MATEAPKHCGEVSLARRNTKLKNETFSIVSWGYNTTAEVQPASGEKDNRKKQKTNIQNGVEKSKQNGLPVLLRRMHWLAVSPWLVTGIRCGTRSFDTSTVPLSAEHTQARPSYNIWSVIVTTVYMPVSVIFHPLHSGIKIRPIGITQLPFTT